MAVSGAGGVRPKSAAGGVRPKGAAGGVRPKSAAGGARPRSASVYKLRSGQQSKVRASVTEYPRNSGNFTITYGKNSPVNATWDEQNGTMTFTDPSNNEKTLVIDKETKEARYTNGRNTRTANLNTQYATIFDDDHNPGKDLMMGIGASMAGTLAFATVLAALLPPSNTGAPSRKTQLPGQGHQKRQSGPTANPGGLRGNASGGTASEQLQTFVDKLLEERATTAIVGDGNIIFDLLLAAAEAKFPGLLETK